MAAEVAKATISHTVPFIYSVDETLDVGEDRGTPILEDYADRMPFKYAGRIDEVEIHLPGGKRGVRGARYRRQVRDPGLSRSVRFSCGAGFAIFSLRSPKESAPMTYANILVETHGAVGLIRLNRPQALNALSAALMEDLNAALEAFETDPAIGAIVLTGSEKAFAAGADIKEMQDKTFAEAFVGDFISRWENVAKARKPIIAAVAGFALGGGCEIAMMCDFILAADTAKFGQPEIKLGVIPGAGGTQRLTRAVGKSKAMEMILTGRMMDAAEAERSGLVSRVVPAASLIEEALKVAASIAALSRPAVYAAKEAVNRAQETTLAEGIRFERRIFHSLFATEDQKEGMRAFAEKRRGGVQAPVERYDTYV